MRKKNILLCPFTLQRNVENGYLYTCCLYPLPCPIISHSLPIQLVQSLLLPRVHSLPWGHVHWTNFCLLFIVPSAMLKDNGDSLVKVSCDNPSSWFTSYKNQAAQSPLLTLPSSMWLLKTGMPWVSIISPFVYVKITCSLGDFIQFLR